MSRKRKRGTVAQLASPPSPMKIRSSTATAGQVDSLSPKTPERGDHVPSPGNDRPGLNTPRPTPAPQATRSAVPTSGLVTKSAEYTLRMSHGWTVYDGTFNPIPRDKRHKRDVPYPSFIDHTFRSMNGLSSLQLSHQAPISLCALDTACDHVWKCMPGEVRRYLHIASPNGPALWSTNEKDRRAMYKKMDDKIYHLSIKNDSGESEYRVYSDLKKRAWIIWPLWVEDEWGSDYVTVIWHLRAAPKKINVFNQLVSYAIIDPRGRECQGAGRHVE